MEMVQLMGVGRRKSVPLGAYLSNLLLAAGLLVATLVAAGVSWGYYVTKGRLGIDWLGILFTAADRWRHGEQIYTFQHGFYYAPPVLLLVRPFSSLGRMPSLVAWTSLSTLQVVGAAFLTAATVRWMLTWRGRLILAWGILASVPAVMLLLVLSQTSSWPLFAMACGMWLFSHDQDAAAGAVLALTLIKPQIGFLVFPLLLYKRRWAAAAAFTGVAIAGTVVSFALVGSAPFAAYLALQHVLFAGTFSNDGMQIDVPGIHGMILQWWPHNVVADRLAYLCAAGLVLLLVWSWRGPWLPHARHFGTRWAMLALICLLVSPFAHIYDTILLVIPVVVLCAAAVKPEAPRGQRRWIVFTLLSLDFTPFLRMIFNQHFSTPPMLLALALLWRINCAQSGSTVLMRCD